MPDKLSRKQLERITGGDKHAIRVLERLLEQAFGQTDLDLTALQEQIDEVEITANEAHSWGNHSTAGYITDAPSDGSLYARKDGSWNALIIPDIDFGDNEKLFFGDDDDAAIWFDGENFYLDPGTGRVKTNNKDVDVGPNGVVFANKICAV